VLRDGIAAAPDNIDMRMQLVSFLARHRDEKAVTGELLSAIAAAPKSSVYDIALADVLEHFSPQKISRNILRVF
jgi:hypothetical protein